MLDDYTFMFRDDGILLNSDADPTAPFVDIVKITGLDSAPFRITERDREGSDGGFIDVEFEKSRTIVLEGFVYSPAEMLEPFLDALKYNFGPSNSLYPFYLRAPGTNDRVVFCKSFGLKYDWDTSRRTGVAEIQIQLSAEDPSIYDVEPVTDTTTLATIVGGRGYNKGYNYGYASTYAVTDYYIDDYADSYGVATVPSDGSVQINNGGNKPTGATITIYGPIRNPAVVHDASGRQISFDIELTTDQYLTIDLRNRTVLLNGTANRRYTLLNTSRWFLLSPGMNNLRLLGIDTVSGSPDPSMVVTARGAYR